MDCVMIDRVSYERIKTECESLESRNVILERENSHLKTELQLTNKLCDALENIKLNLEKTIELIKLQCNHSFATQYECEREVMQWMEEYTNIKMMIEAQQSSDDLNDECIDNEPNNDDNDEIIRVDDDMMNDDESAQINDGFDDGGDDDNQLVQQIDTINGSDAVQVEFHEGVSIDSWDDDEHKRVITAQIDYNDQNEEQYTEVHVQEEDGSIVIRPAFSSHAAIAKTPKPRRNRKSFIISGGKVIVSNEPGTKRFNCTWEGCQYSTNSSGNFQKHYRIHTGEKPFKCDYEGCNYSCSDPGSIKEHRRIHSTEKEFTCDWPGCSWKFTTFKLLKNHIKACHTGEKPHKCDWPGCEKSFLAPYALRTHKLKHTGDRPFKCDISDCPKSFTRSNDLLRHKRETHCLEKKFICEYAECDSKFYRKDDLRHHIKRKHENPLIYGRERRRKGQNDALDIDYVVDKPKRGRGRPRKTTTGGKNDAENFDDEKKVVIDLNVVKLRKGFGRK